MLAASLPLVTAAGSTGVGANDHTGSSAKASVEADPTAAGASATHTATVTVERTGGSSWNSLVVDYTDTGADVSNVGANDVAVLGIDRGDDDDGSTVDVDANDDLSGVSAGNDGQTLRIGLGGSYTPESGDELVAVFGDVQNPPEPGSPEVTLVANEQSTAETATATCEIGPAEDGSTGSDDTAAESDADSTDRDCAEIRFSDQSTSDRTVTVWTSLPDGGFVVVRGPNGDALGNSAYLAAGTYGLVSVDLDTGFEGDANLTAIAHVDVDCDESYDGDDEPYTCDGSPVTDTATVTESC